MCTRRDMPWAYVCSAIHLPHKDVYVCLLWDQYVDFGLGLFEAEPE